MAARLIRIAGGAAGVSTPWRAQDVDFHFLYVLQGRMTLETDGQRQVLETGAAVCQPAS